MKTKEIFKLIESSSLILNELQHIINPKLKNKTKKLFYHTKQIIQILPSIIDTINTNNNIFNDNIDDKSLFIEKLNENDKKYLNKLTLKNKKKYIIKKPLKQTKVPSNSLSRALVIGSLASKLIIGSVSEGIKQRSIIFQSNNNKEINEKNDFNYKILTNSNIDIIANTLSRMRGAALKLGQMLSISDDNILPPSITKALEKVRQSADIMPLNQLNWQLNRAYGKNWKNNIFEEFDMNPIAAASIGQVHSGILKKEIKLYNNVYEQYKKMNNNINNNNNNNDYIILNNYSINDKVAIKVQYPGVAKSIESDLYNLEKLIRYTNVFPPGLFIEELIKVAREELLLECDYELEGNNQIKYKNLIEKDDILNEHIHIPKVYNDISTKEILVSEYIDGISIDKIDDFPLNVRNRIGRLLLYLTIKELFDWKFMQTDPNWSNFIYNPKNDILSLVDFGAARTFSDKFINEYFNLVWAAANNDEEKLLDASYKLGFLTGKEDDKMLSAHIKAGMIVGEPFRKNEPFDFYNSNITKSLSNHLQNFASHRLTPPPKEVYSLHRKLAGAFLICIKLKASINCRDLLETIYNKKNNI